MVPVVSSPGRMAGVVKTAGYWLEVRMALLKVHHFNIY